MKWLICGGRCYRDMNTVRDTLDRLTMEIGMPDLVIHGGARGADALADMWARQRKIPVQVFEANWKDHANSAGPIRNAKMLAEKPHLIIAFPGGYGTLHMITIAQKHGYPVRQIK